MLTIHYLTRSQIDDVKWNMCIDKASNGLIYGNTFYLDILCSHWDALILNDYEAVMPLPWRKKWGIRYVYQPAFIQRLGVFGNLTSATLRLFYRQACKIFLLIHYNVSEIPINSKGFIKERKNFLLSLDRSYEQIYNLYTEECKINIRKAINRGCIYAADVAGSEVIKNFRAVYGTKHLNTTEEDYERLHALFIKAKEIDSIEFSGIKNKEQELIYSAAILRDNKRFYYLLGAPSQEGREKRATYFFIDHLIKTNSNSPRWFDFEGSEIPNVADFYMKFNPQTEYYFEIKCYNFSL